MSRSFQRRRREPALVLAWQKPALRFRPRGEKRIHKRETIVGADCFPPVCRYDGYPSMASSNVTLRDIAERVSLSRMAVSLALRGLPGVPRMTRERVWAVAKELGYRPDPVVQTAMRTLRTSYHKRNPIIVALVTHGANDQWMQHLTLRRYAEGIRKRAEEMGFDLQIFGRHDDGMSDERLSNIMIARGIEHMIVAPLPPTRVGERIQFDWDRFCSVTIARSLESPVLHRVSADHFESARMAYGEIAKRGYRRIGLAMSAEESRRAGGRWHGGFLVAASELGHAAVAPFITESFAKDEFFNWLRAARLDALIAPNEPVSGWLKEKGIRVPEDLAVASMALRPGMDDLLKAGICESFEAVGAAAVNIIAGEVIGRGVGLPKHPINIEVVGEWVEGASLPDRRSQGVAGPA